jgi:hypothetical protein
MSLNANPFLIYVEYPLPGSGTSKSVPIFNELTK